MNALHHACRENNYKIVDILVHKISDINSRTNKKQTALHFAILAGSFDITKFLIENGANFEMMDNNKNTVLHMGCIIGHFQIITYLLELFPFPELKNNDGLTAAQFTNDQKILAALKNVMTTNKLILAKKIMNDEKNTSMTSLYSHNYGLRKPLKISNSKTSLNLVPAINMDFKDEKYKPKFINMNNTVLGVDTLNEKNGISTSKTIIENKKQERNKSKDINVSLNGEEDLKNPNITNNTNSKKSFIKLK